MFSLLTAYFIALNGDTRSPFLLIVRTAYAIPSYAVPYPHPVIPSEVEESRGNEFFLIPRGSVLLLFMASTARAHFHCALYMRLRLDVSTALRLLNMTEEKSLSLRTFYFTVITNFLFCCHSERSRGISWKRILSNSPRRGCYYCSGFVPRGLSCAVTLQRFREMFRHASLAQHDRRKDVSFRA